MTKIKLGIIRERKVPSDKRVPFTPDQTAEIEKLFPNVTVVCQKSRVRCFKDEEYEKKGIEIVDDIYDCDILMGVKEVPISNLLGGKTYLFFSHTIKKQAHNQKLLAKILKKHAHLIDYEVLTDTKGKRLVAFGRYAGIVGAYNALWAYGKRYHTFKLRRAHQCFDLKDLKSEFSKIQLPAIKIVLTGGGRVGKGAMEILDGVGIKKVNPQEFLSQQFNQAVYTQLNSADYHIRISDSQFDRREFHKHPELYKSDFIKYARVADILIAGAFWSPEAPRLFTKKEMAAASFKIKIISDITCDIDGSVPSTMKSTTIDDPMFDYNPTTESIESPLSNPDHISVLAIDNLPCELPRSSSEEFGRDLIDKVLPSLLRKDEEAIIERATIAKNGKLSKRFAYLKEYAEVPLTV